MTSLPDPAARKRLVEIAQLMDAGYATNSAAIEDLAANPANFFQRLKDIQGSYWAKTVAPYLLEIAALTNNSTTTIASVFRPTTDELGLGGVTPDVLRRLASGTGTWRK